jgi:hypothetical protein
MDKNVAATMLFALILLLGITALLSRCTIETTRLACLAAVAKGETVGNWSSDCRGKTP